MKTNFPTIINERLDDVTDAIEESDGKHTVESVVAYLSDKTKLAKPLKVGGVSLVTGAVVVYV
jgi:hypothetical protein